MNRTDTQERETREHSDERRHDTGEHRAVDHREQDRTESTAERTEGSSGTSPAQTDEHAHTGETRSETASHTSERRASSSDSLLVSDERNDLRDRWDRLQARFVDEPRGATEDADELLRHTFDRLTERWNEQHADLREALEDDDATTEALRTTLRRYRDAFERLLTF
ncbi:MAG: hypothetical protein R3343_13475 [Nitriliruptorales bacterium]|nr:hypothetical protein [Nitriliruptorales bacterium]